MNYGWVWGPENPRLDKVARLGLTLRGAGPEQLDLLLDGWLDGLEYDVEHGTYFQGGFSVEVQSRGNGRVDIEFTSGGQDVAESLGYAVDEFCDSVLEQLDAVEVTWTELPLQS